MGSCRYRRRRGSAKLALRTWPQGAGELLAPGDRPIGLWAIHGAAGFVATPNDFGRAGGEADASELLDICWQRSSPLGRPLEKAISSADQQQCVQQSSDTTTPRRRRFDRDDLLCWRRHVRRLAGEARARFQCCSEAAQLEPTIVLRPPSTLGRIDAAAEHLTFFVKAIEADPDRMNCCSMTTTCRGLGAAGRRRRLRSRLWREKHRGCGVCRGSPRASCRRRNESTELPVRPYARAFCRGRLL